MVVHLLVPATRSLTDKRFFVAVDKGSDYTNSFFVTNTPLVPPPHLTKQTTRRDHALTKVTLARSTYQQRVVWVETRTPDRV